MKPTSRNVVLLACLFLVLLGILNAIRLSWVSDDAFITLRYADHILMGDGPVYNPGERVEGYTHPLWLFVLTVGRLLRLDPVFLGRFAGLPAFLGVLFLLIVLSRRFFARPGRPNAMPLAAVLFALHEDVQRYASGGLETAAFTLAVLLGFSLLTLWHRTRGAAAGWAFAVATLLRPEGLLYALVAGAFLGRRDPRRLRGFAAVWLVLLLPSVVFRLLYYGDLVPNTYHAKLAGSAYWTQGLDYAAIYFGCYFVLLLALPATWLSWRRDSAARDALLLAAAFVGVHLVYIVRMGGDYMFARFFIPMTPFLFLLVESLLQRIRSSPPRIAAAVICVGLLLAGIELKSKALETPWKGITDEPYLHPSARLHRVQVWASVLRHCLCDADVSFLLPPGQAGLAYFSRMPVAVEGYGLTDRQIAAQAVTTRGRPGHEKWITPQIIQERQINFRIWYRNVRSLAGYRQFQIPVGTTGDWITGEILVYTESAANALRSCPGVRFYPFPDWLENVYMPRLDGRSDEMLIQDYNDFRYFYFDHNPQGATLLRRLQSMLRERGLRDIPLLAPRPYEDTT